MWIEHSSTNILCFACNKTLCCSRLSSYNFQWYTYSLISNASLLLWFYTTVLTISNVLRIRIYYNIFMCHQICLSITKLTATLYLYSKVAFSMLYLIFLFLHGACAVHIFTDKIHKKNFHLSYNCIIQQHYIYRNIILCVEI